MTEVLSDGLAVYPPISAEMLYVLTFEQITVNIGKIIQESGS